MDAISDPRIETVVVMSSAQVGKTEILNNVVGYYIHQDPSPLLLLQPTLDMAHTWSKDRLAPMLRDTPALRGRVQDPRSKNSGNTLLHKQFPGGHITMAGSNSPASLASRPVRVVLCDEVDRYPRSAGTEGDPVSLARVRAKTFWNRKIILTSTPTDKGASRVELEFEASDKRYFHVPCPSCGEEQRLQWSQVTWHRDDERHYPETARYACEHCGSAWTDAERYQAVKRGQWIASEPTKRRAGFHLSELYSPWVSLESIVVAFLEAKGNPELLKTWVNTSLGETWEDQGDAIDEGLLYNRREDYRRVPEDALLLTAGVDIQEDRIELEVVAWGEGEESWNVDYRVINGDTSTDVPWIDLEDALLCEYEHELGAMMRIAAVVVDSGFRANSVYDFVKQSGHPRVYAGKGVAGEGRPVVKVSRKQSGRKTRNVDVYAIGVDDAKSLIHARLKIEEPGAAGYSHFPDSRELEYFEQLTAEKQITKYIKGFPRREWVKTRARNEALDCRVYSYAALKILNPIWSALARKLQPQTDEPEPIENRRTTQRPRRKAPGRGRTWANDL